MYSVVPDVGASELAFPHCVFCVYLLEVNKFLDASVDFIIRGCFCHIVAHL
jgi:hypothetical protein